MRHFWRISPARLSCYILILAYCVYRLETRTAAEEIIERLHGRMVRGWNDAGSRISVRFADTSEQRELRVSFFSPNFDVTSNISLTVFVIF